MKVWKKIQTKLNKKKREKLFEKFQKTSMATISLLVVAILLVAVTVTWYIISNVVKVEPFGTKVGNYDLIVSKTPGGAQITDAEELEFNVEEFTNVVSGKMAPGTYGTITFYVRTTGDVDMGCNISMDKSELTMTGDDSSVDYNEILQKHIRFYSDIEHTHEITDTELFHFIVPAGEENEQTVNIYWLWPYEDDTNPNYDDEDNLICQWKDTIDGNIKINIQAYSKQPETETVSEPVTS